MVVEDNMVKFSPSRMTGEQIMKEEDDEKEQEDYQPNPLDDRGLIKTLQYQKISNV